MSEQLKKLILQRRLLKGTVTRIQNFVDDPSNLTISKIEILKTRKDKLVSTMREYEQLQVDILLIDPNDDEKVEVIEDKYFDIISKINGTLKSLSESQDFNSSNIATSTLPTIDIPVFSGKDFTKYIPFIDLFTAIFHNNSSLSDVQKLFYLRKYVTDEALAVIVNLPLVNQSYKEALELLKRRYDNKARLICNHINIILDLPTMQRGTAASIRSFISEVQQQIYALKNLDQPIDKCDMWLICILRRKLDQYTNRAFQLDRDPQSLPTLTQFINFLEKRATALEESGDTSTNENKKTFKVVSNVATKVTPKRSCAYCDEVGHSLYLCPKFKLAADHDRVKFVEDRKFCTTCLNDHKGRCKFNFKCKICKSGHNTLLHTGSQQAVVLHVNNPSTQVLLPTVKVKMFGVKGQQLCVRALLDSGSQASFITTSLVNKLSMKPMSQCANIIGLGNKINNITEYVNLSIHSPVQEVNLLVKLNVVDSITTKLPQQHFNISDLKFPKGIKLSDDDFNKPDDILLLLGADIYFKILLDGHIQLPAGLVLQNTSFGYVVGGQLNNFALKNNNFVTNLALCDNSLEKIMENFWLSEKVPESPPKSSEFQNAENIFCKSVKVRDAKFYVDMPLVTSLSDLNIGDSFSIALQRFLVLENKFKKDPMYLELYKKFIDEYIALGHAKVVDIGAYDIHNGPVYFLAHHAVFNYDSKTTKLRVVFNGSMKSRSKVSLNDVMHNGPIVQSELFDILILFRTYLYTLICDITKMFRAVYLNEHHRSLQNILWRDNPTQPILCLQLQTVTYGLKASTYLATRCLIYLAEKYRDAYPLASQAMINNTYIDDILSGTDSIDLLNKLKDQLIELLGKGSFKLHKWCSNVPELLNDIPSENQYFDEIDINKDNIIKTLGLKYNILSDEFTFTCPVIEQIKLKTKRNILSYIGKMFDPLGLIGPIIVVAKLFMQELWSKEIDWDTILPQSLLDTWNKFLNSLNNMGTIVVPRCVTCKERAAIELVGYADASLRAFGCCLYLRVFDQHGKMYINLLCSKSRVAPLNKSLTIPKLELNSALLLAQLSHRVSEKLKARFSFKVFLYSDSQIVLAWLNSQKVIKDAYVSRRVKEINNLTANFQWSYVPSENNPADLLSRGSDPQKLKSCSLWWHGPANLLNAEYVHAKADYKLPNPVKEELVTVNMCTTIDDEFLLFKKYSKLNKLQRVVSLLLRFKSNCLKPTEKIHGVLSPKELHNSLLVIIRAFQKKHFSHEINLLVRGKPIKSNLSNLHPFLDNNNILRVGGRLQNITTLPYEKMHPAIIPKSTFLTSLLIESEHLRLLHAGPKLVLSSLSQRFYLISGMREVKKVVHRCVKCFRVKAAAAKQLMGSLPKERLTVERPFQTVGVDFCGPFSIKVARIRRPLVSKSYIALFVCFVTKAIHVELVTDLTTEAFLACLKRFIARRGLPTLIFCDNAKTFKGASNTLKELYDLHCSKNHKDEVVNFCLEKCITFKFIPSYSPEFGGLWEAGVKSLKFHLKRIVGNTCLTYEGLNTVITEIEAILNSRPLLPMSSDICDTNYLTPGHFLIGTAMTSFPEVDLSHKRVDTLQFWNILRKLKQDFWKAWSNDYLTLLQNRPKWTNVHSNLKVGDLVIVRSDNTSPYQWPMARIVKIFPGPDGRVRVAEVKIGDKMYVRSYRKLCPLPF